MPARPCNPEHSSCSLLLHPRRPILTFTIQSSFNDTQHASCSTFNSPMSHTCRSFTKETQAVIETRMKDICCGMGV